MARLETAWVVETGERGPQSSTRFPPSFETTPLMVDGRLFLSTPLGRVLALDPETGRTLWSVDTGVDPARRAAPLSLTTRGLATWLDPGAESSATCRRRLLLGTADARLLALDAADGRPCRASA